MSAHHIIMTSFDQGSDVPQNLLINYEDQSFESWPGSNSRPASSSSLESQGTCHYGSDSFLSFGGTDFLDRKVELQHLLKATKVDDDFEEYDEKESTTEEELVEKWIKILRTKVPSSPITPPKQKSDWHQHRGGGKLCLEECAALKAFCQEKIRGVQSLQRMGSPTRQAQPSGNTAPRTEMAEPQAAHLVPGHFVSVLRLKSFTEEMKKAVGAELHQPSHCGPCRENMARLAEVTFFQRKRSQLESRLLQDKLQAHLLEKDTICMVGELLSDIPAVSDDPSNIWQELMRNGCRTPQ